MLEVATRITERENIHDLRNLFGIVGAASRLLDDDPPPEKRAMIIAALADAARRGGTLTTALLAKDLGPALRRIDLNEHMAELRALLLAQSTQDIVLTVELSREAAPVEVDPAELDAAVLELVANARTAVGDRGRIVVRTRRAAGGMWVLVADTGRGMARSQLAAVLNGASVVGAHGTGIGRIGHFAQGCGGRFRIRSTPGRGTVAVLVLPLAGVAPPHRAEQREAPAPFDRLTGARAAQAGLLGKGIILAGNGAEPVEPRPDIIEPASPPERPGVPSPLETPRPDVPEIAPDVPSAPPGPSPDECPVSATW